MILFRIAFLGEAIKPKDKNLLRGGDFGIFPRIIVVNKGLLLTYAVILLAFSRFIYYITSMHTEGLCGS